MPDSTSMHGRQTISALGAHHRECRGDWPLIAFLPIVGFAAVFVKRFGQQIN